MPLTIKNLFSRAAVCLLFPVILSACAVNPNRAFQDVNATIQQRTGQSVQWNQQLNPDGGTDAQLAAAVHNLLSQDLTTQSAIQIALLNNHNLQATLERLGIAQADLVQAGLLHNPEFAASWRIPDRSPRQTDAEYALSEDFLDLLIAPTRKKIAAAQLEQTKYEVADAILQLLTDVKVAYYTCQGQQQLLERLQNIAELNQTAADLAQRQHAAGTMSDLDLANLQAAGAQSQLDLAQAQVELSADREKLNRLLGLSGADTAWKITGAFAPIPESEIPAANLLESWAISQRLDLAAGRQHVALMAKSLGITENFRYLAAAKVGVDTERNPGGPNVTGPTVDLEIPIFDQGQSRVAAAQGLYRQARQQLLQQMVDVQSEVRQSYQQFIAQRDLVLTYQKSLLPQRRDIVKLTELHYNAMLKGTYDLLSARQNEINTERAYIQAWRDYWIAHAQLEQAVGGKLPDPAATTQPDATTSPGTLPAQLSTAQPISSTTKGDLP